MSVKFMVTKRPIPSIFTTGASKLDSLDNGFFVADLVVFLKLCLSYYFAALEEDAIFEHLSLIFHFLTCDLQCWAFY